MIDSPERLRKIIAVTTVHYILTNSFYTGDSVWHKFCTTDTLPFQKIKEPLI